MDMLVGLAGMGLIAAVGLLILMGNLPHRLRIWLLNHMLIPDTLMTVLLFWMHWGTFSGMAMATMGALGASAMLRVMKLWYQTKEQVKWAD